MFDDLPLPPMPAFGKRVLARLKGPTETGALAIGLAAATLVCGVAGWAHLLFDGSMHSVALIALKSFANFTPSLKNLDGGNAVTDLSVVLGLLTLYSSAAALVANLLNETRRRTQARLLYRDHALVIGDTPFARRAFLLWSGGPRPTLQVVAPTASKWEGGRSRRVRHGLDASLGPAFSLPRAGRVLIDLDDDMATVTLAYRLAESVASRPAPMLGSVEREWTLVVRDSLLADHLSSRLEALRRSKGVRLPAVHFVEPERTVARHLLARYPPFLEASRRGLPRVHALVMDCGTLGRHLVERIFLTSAVSGQAPPKVTVLCDGPEAERRRFFRGRSALVGEIDLCFQARDTLAAVFEPAAGTDATLLAADRADPVTAVFLTAARPKEDLELAILLRLLSRRTGRLDCPVYVRDDDDATMEGLLLDGAVAGGALNFVPFGLPEAFLRAELEGSRERDALARALHGVYGRSVAPRQVPDWDDLPETLRRANSNAADHGLAKLHSLGFDVSGLEPGAMPRLSREADGSRGGEDPAVLADLARLEHERWRLERLFDGWAHGPVRDEERQFHPLIVPWERLVRDVPDEVAKNHDQVGALLDLLRRTDAATPPLRQRAVATDGPAQNPPPVELQRS